MAERISHQVEGGEFVIRIPVYCARAVMFAVEGPAGVWPTWMVIRDGVATELPLSERISIPAPASSQLIAKAMALSAADLYRAAGTHIRAPHPELVVAAQGDALKLGMCLAATSMLKTLARTEEGSVALRDLVDQPRLDDLQGE